MVYEDNRIDVSRKRRINEDNHSQDVRLTTLQTNLQDLSISEQRM